HELSGDLPRPNAEGPVSGHPGDDALAGVDDAEVVEPGDVDPVVHELGELLRRSGLAACDREPERERPPVAERARWCVPGARAPVAGALGAGAVPDDAGQDTVLHQLDPLLRRAFELERLLPPARGE